MVSNKCASFFIGKTSKYNFFVAENCKYALINTFQGYAVVIDTSANYAALLVNSILRTRETDSRQNFDSSCVLYKEEDEVQLSGIC